MLIFVTLLNHPAARSSHGLSDKDLLELLFKARFQLGVIHAVAIGLQLVVATCVLAFCAQLGFSRPLVALAALAFATATAAIYVAGSFDGFLIPAFAAPQLTLGDGSVDMRAAIAAGAIIIQYSTKLAIALMTLSMLLLSLQLVRVRTSAAAPWFGLGLTIVQAVAIVAFQVLTPRNVALSLLPLLVWQLVLGLGWKNLVVPAP
ncbi:MAG TPA: hypothetical protein VMT95_00950 [Candidatus Binatia bacterium]|nr:hypothetical protein [Candidatus Binatia bacterium]